MQHLRQQSFGAVAQSGCGFAASFSVPSKEQIAQTHPSMSMMYAASVLLLPVVGEYCFFLLIGYLYFKGDGSNSRNPFT